MRSDEPSYPVAITLLGAKRMALDPQHRPHPVQELWPLTLLFHAHTLLEMERLSRKPIRFLAPNINGHSMKLFRNIITVACVVIPFITNGGEQLTANGKCAASQPVAVELQPLQGTWEGVMVGQEKDGKITITITGNSLHFHRDTNFWFETTIALPAGKDPKQLHATIKACPRSQADSIGKVVRAFFKIENGTLTLATIGDDAEETLKGFEAAGTRYELRKVQPQKKDTQPPKNK